MIKTAGSDCAPCPRGMLEIDVNAASPRGHPGRYHRLPSLNPGLWFRSVDPQIYLSLYNKMPSATRSG